MRSIKRRLVRRPLEAGMVVVGIGLGTAVGGGAASAHIAPEPASVPSGSPQTISLTVEHGCEGSPTVKVELRIPDGFREVTATEVPGWTSAVGSGSVTWEGGPLDPETEGTFGISFIAPSPGEFPIPMIQTCEVGELAWIQIEVEGLPEPANPAPVLTVTQGEVVAPPAAETTTAASVASSDQLAPDATASSVVVVASPPSTAPPTSPTLTDGAVTDEADGTPGRADDEGDSYVGVVAVIVAGVVVVATGGYFLSRQRGGPKRA
jgi:hypothetical protein